MSANQNRNIHDNSSYSAMQLEKRKMKEGKLRCEGARQ